MKTIFKKHLLLLLCLFALLSSCTSQNKKPLTQHEIDSLKILAQLKAQIAAQNKGQPQKANLSDVQSCYQYLNGKYYQGISNIISFDVDSHTGTYKGDFNSNALTKVYVDIRLGGIGYATVTFTDPTGRQQRLPICNMTRDGEMSDETSKMTLIPGLCKVVPATSINQQPAPKPIKIDTLTLIGGGSNPGIFLYFKDKNKRQLMADGKIDSAYSGNSKVTLFVGIEPPIKVDPKYLNKQFQVYYQSDSIPTPDDDIVLGLKVSKLVLVKSSENKLKGLLNKVNH